MATKTPVKVKFNLEIGLYTQIKLFLRGMQNLGWVAPALSRLQQMKLEERAVLECSDKDGHKYNIVVIRKSLTSGYVITGWYHDEVDIKERAKSLLNMLYDIMFNGMNSLDIRKYQEVKG